MQPPIDLQALSAPAQRILDPKGPPPLRQMAAKGIVPGLKPHEAVAVVALLAEGPDAALAEIAAKTLSGLPAPLLAGALVPELHPGVLATLAPHYATRVDVMEKVLNLPQIPVAAVELVATMGSEAVCELVATNEERLLAHPTIIERLYLNKATRMSTSDRILELAVRNRIELTGIPAFKEAAEAILDQLIPEPTEEETYDDRLFKEVDAVARANEVDPSREATHVIDETTGEERPVEKVEEVEKKWGELTVSQRIRRVTLGTASERALGMREHNKLVAMAAIKSPLIQENEVVRIAASRNVNDVVLKYIAGAVKYARNYDVKKNLAFNPRTPLLEVSKIIPYMFESDLKKLAADRNVPGNVKALAKNQLDRKKKK
jgi:hypothetical protein